MNPIEAIAFIMALVIEAGKKLCMVLGILLYVCFAVYQPLAALICIVVFFAAKPHVVKWYRKRRQEEC